MSNHYQFLIVENNRSSISRVIEEITASGIQGDFRVALNSAHALVHIDHLHLSGKIRKLKLIVLLNMHTPLHDGFEFLKHYLADKTILKEQIKVVVFEDNLSFQEKERVEESGITNFLSSPFRESIIDILGPGEKKTEALKETPTASDFQNTESKETNLSKKDKKKLRKENITFRRPPA